jgi:hypothetical protein
MLSYLTIGANDVAVSTAFYRVILAPLGYDVAEGDGYARFSLPEAADKDNGPGTVYVMKPFDGAIATAGNGMMPAFRAGSASEVDRLHAAGLSAGGADEGAPGTRALYSDNFYVGYLRDPVGNKLAIFCVLSP